MDDFMDIPDNDLEEFYMTINKGEEPDDGLVEELLRTNRSEIVNFLVFKNRDRMKELRQLQNVLGGLGNTKLERTVGLDTPIVKHDNIKCLQYCICSEIHKIHVRECSICPEGNWYHCTDWSHLREHHFEFWVDFQIELFTMFVNDLPIIRKRSQDV